MKKKSRKTRKQLGHPFDGMIQAQADLINGDTSKLSKELDSDFQPLDLKTKETVTNYLAKYLDKGVYLRVLAVYLILFAFIFGLSYFLIYLEEHDFWSFVFLPAFFGAFETAIVIIVLCYSTKRFKSIKHLKMKRIIFYQQGWEPALHGGPMTAVSVYGELSKDGKIENKWQQYVEVIEPGKRDLSFYKPRKAIGIYTKRGVLTYVILEKNSEK